MHACIYSFHDMSCHVMSCLVLSSCLVTSFIHLFFHAFISFIHFHTFMHLLVNYHDDIYGPEVHEVGPHVVSCMLYIQVIVKA